MRRKCVAYSKSGLVSVAEGTQGSLNAFELRQEWVVVSESDRRTVEQADEGGYGVLVQPSIELDFGDFISAPPALNWDGIMAVHHGCMDSLPEDATGWIRFEVIHPGGLFDLFMCYAAGDSRPMRLRVDGVEISGAVGVASQVTGGFGHGELRWFDDPECELDLGPRPGTAVLEFRARSFAPHVSKIRLEPRNGRRLVEGYPRPQDYNGERTSDRRHTPLVREKRFEGGGGGGTGSTGSRGNCNCSGSGPSTTEDQQQWRVFDDTTVEFQGKSYGGVGRTARLAAFRAQRRYIPLLRRSLVKADDVLPGARYESQQLNARCRELGQTGEPSEWKSDRWRVSAPSGPHNGQRWVVRSLRLVGASGEVIAPWDASAICSGSCSDQLGPENALGCRPERWRRCQPQDGGGTDNDRGITRIVEVIPIATGLENCVPRPGSDSGMGSTGYDMRCGSRGCVNTLDIKNASIHANGTIVGCTFTYRYVVGYSLDQSRPFKGPSFQLVALQREDDGTGTGAFVERAHVLYQSPEFGARPYNWDWDEATKTGNPKNYSPTQTVNLQCLSVPVTSITTFAFVVDNGERNMHLQGGAGEGCDFGLGLTIEQHQGSDAAMNPGGSPWVGQRVAEEPRDCSGDRGDASGSNFWLGLHFPSFVEVTGIEMLQGGGYRRGEWPCRLHRQHGGSANDGTWHGTLDYKGDLHAARGQHAGQTIGQASGQGFIGRGGLRGQHRCTHSRRRELGGRDTLPRLQRGPERGV
jgi:hypothetical protein